MPRTPKPKQPKCVYQLKVTLRNIRPPIWRRLLVTSDTKLSRLHDILQAAMGWWGGHLHQFTARGVYYGDLQFVEDLGWGPKVHDEHRFTLADVARGEKAKLLYEYDFGDGWEHDIVVEKVLPVEKGVRYPICIKGRRACPPEDVGGPWGYGEFLEALRDPNHPEHETYSDWIEGSFDPEAFDLDSVNKQLKTSHLRPSLPL
jgi:hypothetical protein